MTAEAIRAEVALMKGELAARLAAQPPVWPPHLKMPLEPCSRLADTLDLSALSV